MSAHKVVLTEMKNQVLIAEALRKVLPQLHGQEGFQGQVQTGKRRQNELQCEGHMGSTGCDIVVKKEDLLGKKADSAYSDIGLKWNAKTGKYEWIVSDCDLGNYEKLSGDRPDPNGHFNSNYGLYGEEFMNEVGAAYACLEQMEESHRTGATVVSEPEPTQVGGRNVWKAVMEIDEDQLAVAGVTI